MGQREEQRMDSRAAGARLRSRIRLLFAGPLPPRIEVAAMAARQRAAPVHDGSGECRRQRADGRNLCPSPFKSRVRLAFFCLLHSAFCIAAAAQTVRITEKPEGLVHGTLNVPIVATAPVTRLALFINNVKYTESPAQRMVAQVRLGDYIRRMRMRAVGYDAQGNIAGEDEMVVNDPRPPFRVKAIATRGSITATVIHPVETQVTSVDLYLGEEKIATVASPPYVATYDAAKYPNPLYARVVAHSSDGNEANDVFFFRA